MSEGAGTAPRRWQGRERFVILDTAFDQGQRFLRWWQAWRDDAARCERLHVIVLLPHSVTAQHIRSAHAASPQHALALQLAQAWPVMTRNLHPLSFDDGRVQLLLAPRGPKQGVSDLVARVDAFFVDYARLSLPSTSKALGRLAAEGASLTCELPPGAAAVNALRDALTANGFVLDAGANMSALHARYAPRFTVRSPPSRAASPASPNRHALIVGAGLAGAATAWALAEQGWTSRIVDRHAQPAQDASGNAAGLFHGIVNPQDGVHARFNRAAALAATDAVRIATTRHGVGGSREGLLRLESTLDLGRMQAILAACGLPPEYVQAVDAAGASQRAGLPLTQAAWFYPGGGWVEPQGLVSAFMARAGTASAFTGSTSVHALRRQGARWQLLDANGSVIDESDVVVLANAADALRLLGTLQTGAGWPLKRVRGQISELPADTPGLPRTRLPLTGSGYLLPPWRGQTRFGATSQAGDEDGSVRAADHAQNLLQLARLTQSVLDVDAAACSGRTAWRCVTPDRLPVIGAVPDSAAAAGGRPLDQARFVPRLPGLFVFTGLGSRGITWSALGAQTLAAWISGAPSPLEADLLNAVDPARFIAKAVRREASRKARG